jgi:hypothetical protein
MIFLSLYIEYLKWIWASYRPQCVLLHQLHASYTLRFLHAMLSFLHATLRFLHAMVGFLHATLRFLHAFNTFWSHFEIAWKWLKLEMNKKLGKEIIMGIYDTE